MPDKPLTYDEITRRTVPEPDSSRLPTREQEEAAFRGFRATTPDEDQLGARVRAALGSFDRAGPFDLTDVAIEITGARVALRGKVRDVALIDRLAAAATEVPGVQGVDNFLVVGA